MQKTVAITSWWSMQLWFFRWSLTHGFPDQVLSFCFMTVLWTNVSLPIHMIISFYLEHVKQYSYSTNFLLFVFMRQEILYSPCTWWFTQLILDSFLNWCSTYLEVGRWSQKNSSRVNHLFSKICVIDLTAVTQSGFPISVYGLPLCAVHHVHSYSLSKMMYPACKSFECFHTQIYTQKLCEVEYHLQIHFCTL